MKKKFWADLLYYLKVVVYAILATVGSIIAIALAPILLLCLVAIMIITGISSNRQNQPPRKNIEKTETDEKNKGIDLMEIGY